MEPTLFTVRRRGAGRLSTMARPRGGDWLVDEIQALRQAGADVLVSLLTPSELTDLELLEEEAAATAAGIRFVSLATPDRSLPDAARFRLLLDDLGAELAAGRHVVIHCRMGIGRSSMVAAGLLLREGQPPGRAWATIREARGVEVPDTPEQRSWVEAVAQGW